MTIFIGPPWVSPTFSILIQNTKNNRIFWGFFKEANFGPKYGFINFLNFGHRLWSSFWPFFAIFCPFFSLFWTWFAHFFQFFIKFSFYAKSQFDFANVLFVLDWLKKRLKIVIFGYLFRLFCPFFPCFFQYCVSVKWRVSPFLLMFFRHFSAFLSTFYRFFIENISIFIDFNWFL